MLGWNYSGPFDSLKAQNELGKGKKLIAIGGDHSITFPLIQAHANQYKSLNFYDHLW